MAKAAQKKNPSGVKWGVLVAGLASILVGYIFLAMADITVAPILLVLGYCVLVPLAFLSIKRNNGKPGE